MHTQEMQHKGMGEKSGKVPLEPPQKKKDSEAPVERPLEPHWVALIDGATD